MARLPIPGSDAGNWGEILNDYLSQVHGGDGTLKDGSVGLSVLAATNTPASNQVLSFDGTHLTWTTPSSAPVTSVNTQTGDVVLNKTDLGLSNVDNTSDANKPVSTATQTALNTKLTASNNLSDVADAATARINLGLDSAATMTPTELAQNTAFTGSYAPKENHALSAASSLYARLATPGTPQQLRWVSLGDSMAYLKMRWMNPLISRALGGDSSGAAVVIEAGQSGTGWGIPGVTTNATSGAFSGAVADFDAWFTGKSNRFTGGATASYGRGGVAATWDSAKVYYAKGPGALDNGSFKIQIDSVDEVGFTNISTVAATQDIGIATITRGTVAQRNLSVVNLTGSHRIVGVAFFRSDLNGLVHAGLAQGGISMASPAASTGAMTSLATFLTDFAPHVISLEVKESSADFAASLSVILPVLRSAVPTATIIGIGSTPVASNDADQVVQNAQLKAACQAHGCTYWDGYTPIGSYAQLVALGWQGDGTHPSDHASAFLGGLLMRDLGILDHPAAAAGRNINTVNGTFSGTVGIGTTSPTQLLDVVAPNVSTHATMSLRNIGTTGQNAVLNLMSGFSGTQGNASIVATLAELRLNASTVGGTGSALTVYTAGGEKLRVNNLGHVILGGSSGPLWARGTGSPEGVLTAPVGSYYSRTDGGAGTTFYVKESGTGNTGWVAK